MTDLQDLTNKILEFRKERGWIKGRAVSAKNQAIALLLEAAEFLELFEWTEGNQPPRDKKEEMEDELIDVLYWVLVIGHDLEIDIKEAFERKMKKNKLKYPV